MLKCVLLGMIQVQQVNGVAVHHLSIFTANPKQGTVPGSTQDSGKGRSPIRKESKSKPKTEEQFSKEPIASYCTVTY